MAWDTCTSSSIAAFGGPNARPVRFVLFDLYETLVVFHMHIIHAARRQMAERLGIEHEALEHAELMTEERMCGQLGDTLEEELATIMRQAGATADDECISVYRDTQLRAWQDATFVHEDVIPCLDALSDAGVRLGLVSNCSHLTRPLMRMWRLEPYFVELTLSCELGCIKPDERILRSAVAAMGEPEDGLLIDDRAEYVQAASGIGLRGCQIVRRGPWHPNGHAAIGDLRDLSHMLVGDRLR